MKIETARHHHYFFAYRYLLERVNSNARQLIKDLSGEPGKQQLEVLWTVLGQDFKARGEEFVSAEGLNCFEVEIGKDYYGVIVEMPKPERMVEAYFVAILAPTFKTTENLFEFYSLAYSKKGSQGTVLGRWIPGGSHFNLGDGPAPEIDKFIAALQETLGKGVRSNKEISRAARHFILGKHMIYGTEKSQLYSMR